MREAAKWRDGILATVDRYAREGQCGVGPGYQELCKTLASDGDAARAVYREAAALVVDGVLTYRAHQGFKRA